MLETLKHTNTPQKYTANKRVQRRKFTRGTRMCRSLLRRSFSAAEADPWQFIRFQFWQRREMTMLTSTRPATSKQKKWYATTAYNTKANKWLQISAVWLWIWNRNECKHFLPTIISISQQQTYQKDLFSLLYACQWRALLGKEGTASRRHEIGIVLFRESWNAASERFGLMMFSGKPFASEKGLQVVAFRWCTLMQTWSESVWIDVHSQTTHLKKIPKEYGTEPTKAISISKKFDSKKLFPATIIIHH